MSYPSHPMPIAANLPPDPGTAKKPWHRRLPKGKLLVVSLLVHLVLILGATYLVVQSFAPRKQTFKPGPAATVNKTVEHKIDIVKKQKSMSAPAQMNRIVSTAPSKVVLPEMPPITTDVPTQLTEMAGMGGQGVAFATSGGGLDGGGSPGGVQLFGLKEKAVDALVGTFYDMKQTRGGRPNDMNPDSQAAEILGFVRGGWTESRLQKYFKGPDVLYAKQIAIPSIQATEGPKAFNLADKVKPQMWIVLYKARVIAPRDGTFHFVALGDDYCYIRLNNRVVMDAGWMNENIVRPEALYLYSFDSHIGAKPRYREKGFVKGPPINVKQGQVCDLSILIGEGPGGEMGAQVMVEWEGTDYDKDPQTKSPILSLFRLGDGPPPPRDHIMGPFKDGGDVWKVDQGGPVIKPH